MPDRGKTSFVDGLVTLRATQLHQRERRYSNKVPVDEELEAKRAQARQTGVRKTGMHIGRTVMPTQNEIVCYACNFQFVMRGRADVTQCPKCGARLSLKDEKITGGFSEELVTAGKVTLTKSAILDGGTIIANDIVLEGTAKRGTLKAFRTLELAAGAVLPEELLEARHLTIGEGAAVQFQRPLRFEHVEIRGALTAHIDADTVALRATGHFSGNLKTVHFTVEEGAGLTAKVAVQPPVPDPEPEDPENDEQPREPQEETHE
jgi:cytoskeletal protein CcmA (bactofilin family)/predicted RNA-binding Zn-ribbon protein involved in translation (DUF1610 family)